MSVWLFMFSCQSPSLWAMLNPQLTLTLFKYSMRKKKFCIKKSMICEQGSVSDKDYKGTSLVSTYTALLPKMGSQFESLESL